MFPRPHRRAALLVVALVVGCQREVTPVVSGKEEIYAFLSRGQRSYAEELLMDRWDLGPREEPRTIRPLTWREDGSKYWRFVFYSLRPTSNLLWGYYALGDTRFRDKLLGILDSYADYDVAHLGEADITRFQDPHASSFRAMVLVNSYVKLGRSHDLPPALAAKLKGSIERLGSFLAEDSNFEPVGNHGFNEAAALLLIATVFPDLAQSAAWLDIGLGRANAQIASAVDVNGVEVENSPFYHFYVLTLAAQMDAWSERYQVPIGSIFGERLRKMNAYATHITLPDGQVPLLGASVVANVRALEPDVYDQIGAADPAFQYIYTGGHAGTAPVDRNIRFPVSGQGILHSGFGGAGVALERETHVTFNVGLWRTNHSHLDVLAINYYSAGATLLPDSGLFTYELGPERSFFFGTSAHNTVVVDGADQSRTGPNGVAVAVQPGLVTSGPDWAYQSGAHQFYPGVSHRRGLLLLQRDLLLVVDLLASQSAHDYAQIWHVAPSLQVTADVAGVSGTSADGPRLVVRQALTDGMSVKQFFGSANPLQGWCSELYGTKVKNAAIEYHKTDRTAAFITLIASGDLANDNPAVRGDLVGTSGIRAVVCAGAVHRRVAIDNLVAAGEAVMVEDAAPGDCP